MGFVCSECGVGTMVERNGKHGRFLACDQYPECSHTERVVEKPSMIAEAKKPTTLGKDLMIIRQVCVKAACDWCSPDVELVSLLTVCNELEKWILR